MRFISDVVAGGRYDPSEPFYVVELGAGSGLFGFHLVRRLTQLTHQLGVGDVRIVYLMTDVVPANIEYWRQHPRLRPFVDAGLLAFGRFDVLADHTVHLVPGGGGGEGDEIRFANPPAVIANYLFDSVPQDIFRMNDGQLETLMVSVVPSIDEHDPAKPVMRLVGSFQPAAPPRYGDAKAEALLAELLARSDGIRVVFPIAALRCLERLVDAASGRLCLLVSDLGPAEEPVEDVDLELSSDLFYLAIDVDVIGQYLGRLGPGLHRVSRSATLDTGLSVIGFDPSELRETQHAFSMWVESFGARGHRTIAALVARAGSALEPEQWLALAAMLRYDPRLVDESVGLVTGFVSSEKLSPRQRQELVAALLHIADNTYRIPAAPDTLFNVGLILDEMDETELAIGMFTTSLQTMADAPETQFSLGLCLQSLGRYDEALDSFRRVVELDARHVLARGWIAQIEADQGGAGASGL
jgi:tetratricopeptide (TPR) repeat protein